MFFECVLFGCKRDRGHGPHESYLVSEESPLRKTNVSCFPSA